MVDYLLSVLLAFDNIRLLITAIKQSFFKHNINFLPQHWQTESISKTAKLRCLADLEILKQLISSKFSVGFIQVHHYDLCNTVRTISTNRPSRDMQLFQVH